MTDIVYLRDLDGSGSMHVCAEGDKGAVAYMTTRPFSARTIAMIDSNYVAAERVSRMRGALASILADPDCWEASKAIARTAIASGSIEEKGSE